MSKPAIQKGRFFSFPGSFCFVWVSFDTLATDFDAGFWLLPGKRCVLFGRSEFRPERQHFFHRSQLIWGFRVQGHPFQLIPYTQSHQVISCELWSGHTLAFACVQFSTTSCFFSFFHATLSLVVVVEAWIFACTVPPWTVRPGQAGTRG
jgi:hypothetical protein